MGLDLYQGKVACTILRAAAIESCVRVTRPDRPTASGDGEINIPNKHRAQNSAQSAGFLAF